MQRNVKVMNIHADGCLYIIVKLPFPLTPRFKTMLQSGVNTRDMDVTWVSSLSWYFLNLFGLGSVFALILGDNNGMSIKCSFTKHKVNIIIWY